MIRLREAQSLFTERGIRCHITTCRRWARQGKFGAIFGKRDRCWLMRRREVLHLLHHGGTA